MRYHDRVEIRRPADEVYAVYVDVVGWPSWTRSISSVERLDPGPLQIGSRTRVEQPRLRPTVWTVTELVPGRTFTWESQAPGLRSTGRHTVSPTADGCVVEDEIEQVGPLAPVVALFYRRLIQSYLQLECQGLKARCEGS
jgi:uncharacterized membrane protein